MYFYPLLYLYSLFRVYGIIFSKKIYAVLIHADSLFLRVLCQCPVQAPWNPQLELSRIIFQTVWLMDFHTIIYGTFQPRFFRIQCIRYRAFYRFTTSNTPRQIRFKPPGHFATFIWRGRPAVESAPPTISRR